MCFGLITASTRSLPLRSTSALMAGGTFGFARLGVLARQFLVRLAIGSPLIENGCHVPCDRSPIIDKPHRIIIQNLIMAGASLYCLQFSQAKTKRVAI
jgi:hypothetical protein